MKQKSIATVLLIALGVTALGASPALADDTAAVPPQSQITTSVNGTGADHIEKYTMSNTVINEEGTLYLPLRSGLEQMGAAVTANPDKQNCKLQLTIEGQNYQLFYNNDKTAISLTEAGTKHPVKVVGGVTYAPMAFFQELTNRVVSVSGSTLVLINQNQDAPFWKTLEAYTVDPNYVQKSTRERIVETAKKYIGVPYVWGGTTPAGFDCSGFVQYVYRECGMSIPRVTYTQQAACTPVAMQNLQPGDLVFWGGSAYHVGIYLGNNQYIHAPAPGQSVKIQSYYEYPYTSGGAIIK